MLFCGRHTHVRYHTHSTAYAQHLRERLSPLIIVLEIARRERKPTKAINYGGVILFKGIINNRL